MRGLLTIGVCLGCWVLTIRGQVVDSEARTYVNEKLAPYLDSMAAQVCRLKYQHAAAASGRLICPASDKPSPKAPHTKSPGRRSDAKDSEARRYIRYQLEPLLDSLAYQLCHIKFKVDPGNQDPGAQGGDICPGPPDGYHKPPGNGAP
ncbi:MAG TPA: hypothetical protein VFZ90_16150 [Gemmatimonadales bacterium]